jgi:hypothetical protein
MKKIMVALTVLFMSLILSASRGEGYGRILGYYSFIGDTIVAVNENVCMHEVAHKMDFKDAGFSGKWISTSDAWRKANADYKGDLTELYADTFQMCNAHEECVPEELRPFYDFNLGEQLIRERCIYGMPQE